jgi:hypothetical protein
MKEGVTTTMKRRKGEGLAAPLMGGYPLSPIYMLDILLFSLHFLVLLSPAKLLPQIRLGLAKLCRIVSLSFTLLEK